MYFPS
jgi:hypothetical protein